MESNSVIEEMANRLCNWGKWGDEDEMGTLNYINPEKVIQASRLVKQGKVFSLSILFQRRGPQSTQYGRLNPILVMQADGSDVTSGAQERGRGALGVADDLVIMSVQCATHWDAFAHNFYQGKMYNGYPASLVTSLGAKKNSIVPASEKTVSRGVLLDLARYKQVDTLGDYIITRDDLEGCCHKQDVTIQPADIVLLRTGFMTRFLAEKNWEGYDSREKGPGLSWKATPWFQEHQIAAVASDLYGIDAHGEANEVPFRVHTVFLYYMGLMIGEIWYLDELAQDCAEDGVYEFLLVANPIPLRGAVGAPVNPTAIK